MLFFTSPGNVAFSLFGFDVYFYGIFMAIAIFVAIFLSNYLANKYYSYRNIVLDVSPSVLLWGIIGARLYYCILNYSFYINDPISILAIRNGGLSIHGALLGGVLALLFEAKRYKLNFWELCDIFAYSLPLAQSIARWGNFFNSEAFGLPTNLPWKLYIPIQFRPEKYINYDYFHPTFLYESILDFIIFIVLIISLRHKDKITSGNVFIHYIILYSLARIFVELFRIDCQSHVFSIPVPIFVSLLFLIFSIGYLIYRKIRH